MILCDTDIMIEALKDTPQAVRTLREIGYKNIALSSVTLMELYFGALNKKELAFIKKRLAELEVIKISDEISDEAVRLIENYSKSHKLHIPDALIAATAICNNLTLLTYNNKDFKFIQGVCLYAGESSPAVGWIPDSP